MESVKLKKVLEGLRGLPEKWDSYKAQPITEAALSTAKVLLSNDPSITPTTDGGLQIEWHCEGIDFEFQIGPDGHEDWQYGLKRSSKALFWPYGSW